MAPAKNMLKVMEPALGMRRKLAAEPVLGRRTMLVTEPALGMRMMPVPGLEPAQNMMMSPAPEPDQMKKGPELALVTLGLRLCKMSVSEQALLNLPRKELSKMSFLYQQLALEH